MAQFIVAKHVTDGRVVIAITDKSVHGRKYEDEKTGAVLDLSAKFYQGQEKNKEEAEKLLTQAHIINAAGKESIVLLEKVGWVDREAGKIIAGVPHVQVLMIS